jgi:hypothetical protein
MGWWGKGIMQGDPALDAEGEIADLFGFEDLLSDEPIDKVKQLLTERQDDVYRHFKTRPTYYIENSVGHQVLAYLMLQYGATFDEGMKEALVESISNDMWALQDEERRGEIDHLIECLNKYDGTPIHIENKGLIETISETFKKPNK